jgi:hypothetical protein
MGCFFNLTCSCSRALERLRGERNELRRYGAVLVLKELAVNAPSLFNTHAKDFFVLIWSGIRDPKPNVREASIDALRAGLQVKKIFHGGFFRKGVTFFCLVF